jgi:predicted nucleic acid-binding protein
MARAVLPSSSWIAVQYCNKKKSTSGWAEENSNSKQNPNGEKSDNLREKLPLAFIDSNVLFRMFAASPQKIRQYQETLSCGKESLDYAIGLLLNLGWGGYSTSEIALLETISVASRLAIPSKAEILLQSVIMQEDFWILETRAPAYPLVFAFVLTYQLEARDSLHLAVAALAGVTALITSDRNFADGTESVVKQVALQGFQIPKYVSTIYGLTDREATLIEGKVAQSLSLLSVQRAPAWKVSRSTVGTPAFPDALQTVRVTEC